MKENLEDEETKKLIDQNEDQDIKLNRNNQNLLNNKSIGEEESDNSDNIEFKTLDSLLRTESNLLDFSLTDASLMYKKNDIVLAKHLYIAKDFTFMLILLISSGLNFSWLYFPFLFLSFICYFLLFKSTKSSKKLKKFIEYFSLIYALGILSLKIYYIILIKNGYTFIESYDRILDLGIPYLLNCSSLFFLIITILGESLIIIFSIIAIIISYLCSDFDTSDKITQHLTKDKFFELMTICIYFAYFMIIGFAIFNRSILTLCYIFPMNLMLYFFSMNLDKKCLFYVFKFISIIMIFAISAQIVLINYFNIYSIRNKYIDDDMEDDPYPRIINFWTQLGINQAFDETMPMDKITKEFCGYFFAIASLLVLIYSHKKLTKEKMINAYFNKSDNILNKEEDEKEEEYNNWFIEFLSRIKDYFFSPSFILHTCRISAILWLYFYQNFYSIGVIIWLFFSFLFIKIKSNRFVTIIFLSPMVIICLFCYHFSNIDGLCKDIEGDIIYSRFGLKKFEHKIIEYILCNVFYFLVNLFTYTIFIRIEKQALRDKKKKEKTKNQLQKEEIDIDKLEISNNINNIIDNSNNQNEELDLSLLPNENEIKKEEPVIELNNKEINELYKNLNLFNIILKAIFSNIDKITLIAMYFLAVQSINIIHFILVIIFMIQLLSPMLMEKHSLKMLIFCQIIFFVEYIIHLFKSSNISKDTLKLIKLFIPFDSSQNDTSIEYWIYVTAYCFYTQHHLYNYKFYQQLIEDNNISLSTYIEIKLFDYPLFQKILFFIGKFILEIYIWTLISVFIVFDSYFEISVLLGIKLLIFLLIVYKFLLVIQSDKKISMNLILNWIFLIFCAINTLSVYIFQILCLEIFPINESIQNSNKFWVKNLPAFGLYRYYEKNLYVKFLPHFMSNLISVLFIGEMRRLLKEIEENKLIRNEVYELNDLEKKKNQLLIKKKTFDDTKKKLLFKKKSIEETKNKLIKRNSEKNLNIENKKELILEKEKNEDNKDNQLDRITEENEIENKDNEEEDEKISASQEYEDNKNKMYILEVKYYLFNIILICTKFYWLFLFLSICIIFTTYDLSILLIIYILIFGITFIRMFRHIITSLTKFISKKSFFISRLIRFNLIEQVRHVKENIKYRSLAFKYLLIFSFLSYYLFYLNGIFNLIQNGCQCQTYNCDKNHDKIFNQEYEELIISYSYILGFNINLKKETVLFAGWVHLFFAALVCFDVYVQKTEIYYNKLSEENRKNHKKLSNRNIQLKPLTFGEDNILMNIGSRIETLKIKEDEQQNENEIKTNEYKNRSKSLIKNVKTMSINFDILNGNESQIIGEKLIEDFLLIFDRASKNDVKLSKSNKKYNFIQILKKIFEEIIIFLLICTAISKLNIWSLIYMMFALYLILTQKSMMKFYVLYCFILATILLQSILFVSNLNKKTDPNPDEELILIMDKTFNIPWYKKNNYTGSYTEPIINIKDENAFFFGLGVSHSQINLIWMDFIEVVIIYIYLDYFSYSIYQEANAIGKLSNKDNKINYYNLFLNKQVRQVGLKINSREYKKHEKCMKYNFDLTILDYKDFKYYMINGKNRINIEDEKNKNLIDEENNKKEEDIQNEKIPINLENKDNKEDKSDDDNDFDELKIEEESPLQKALNKAKNKAQSQSNIISNLNDDEKTSIKIYDIVRKFIYLSIHNVILIVIIIISMMISGLISVYYIIFSLYFLITSTRIYLGSKYYYPKAIKTILRISILVDISLQIIYQSPYIDIKVVSDKKKTIWYTILEIIGLNKILSFDFSKDEFCSIDVDQMILVLAKAFIYFFMSMQVLVYSSQSFQEYYLSYIITKNDNLRRVALMNVFRFNNKRIQVMEKGIQIREEMSKEMDKLKRTLEKWNENIIKYKNTNQNNLPKIESKESNKNLEIQKNNTNEEEEKEEDEKDEKEEEKEEKEENNLSDAGSNLLLNLMKLKSTPIPNKLEESHVNDEDLTINKDNLKTQTTFIPNIDLENPFISEEGNQEYVPEKEVIEAIKTWLLGGFLINLQIKLHRLAANYNNISKNEKDIYERDTIQGKIQSKTFIENLLDAELRPLDLSHFTLAEMNEVKTFFDGTRKKKLEEKKKEKEKMNKLKKSIFKAQLLGSLNKKIENNKKVVKFDEDDKKKKFKIEDLILSVKESKSNLDLTEKKQEEKKVIINLKAPKFKKLEKFMTNKIFIKYLKTGYILKCIIKDCIAFCSNNFHWVCYTIMVLNHIMSSSILSLFYPLSIFCYAIFEYPRPSQSYWSLCFIYTLSISALKFIIQLKFFRSEAIFYYINLTSQIKLGLHICDSTFSKDFFIYILFDYLVLIILLINNYLLVSKGLYLKREQEIENIYQAMERVSMTKDLVIEDLINVKKFNDSYLLKEEKKLYKKKKKDTNKNRKKELEAIDEEIEIIQRFDSVHLDNSDFDKEKKTKIHHKKNSKKYKKFKNLILNKKEKEKEKEKKEEKEEEKGKEKEKKEEKKEEEIIDKEKIKKDKEKKKKEKEEKQKEKDKYDESKRTYFQSLFPRVRNEKPGNEYYVSYTLIMTSIIIYILLFYTTMVQDKTFGAVTIETKQFSGAMVGFLVLHIIFLVYDRIIFISQNRNNLSYEYILYDKQTKIPLTELQFNQIKSEISKEYPNVKRDYFIIPPEYADKLKQKYNIVYIQREEFNCPLFQKYLLHLIIVIFGHIFVFFFMPMLGNLNINNNIYCKEGDEQCNDFLENKYIITFYFLYIIYFVGSGLQIKYGFYDMKRKSVLKSKNNSLYGGIYNGYKTLPFLYEIKLGIDWTFTSTCLDLFQWNKFESVYDILYTTNCVMTGINAKVVGQQVGKIVKILMGGTLSFVLIFILIIPLIIFSSLNPMNQLNNLTNADIKVDIGFMYKNSLMKNYTIFQNTKPQSIESISDEDLNNYNYTRSLNTKNFPRNQIQTVTFFKENDRNWELSTPHINNLIKLIKNRNNTNETEDNELDIKQIYFSIDYSFYRLLPAEAQNAKKNYHKTIFSSEKYDEEQNEKMELLELALDNCYDVNITYKEIISPPIRLTSSPHPKRYTDEIFFNNLDVQLGFVGCKNISYGNKTNNKTYLESYFTFAIYNKTKNITEEIKFHVFSDMVSSTTFSSSVLTFYLAFVLVIGNYVRSYFSGQPEQICLTEMPHNEELLNLCEGIKISRYNYNLEEEEKLYYILIEIMRSPDYLKLLTSSSIDQFSQRLLMSKSNKTSDDAE